MEATSSSSTSTFTVWKQIWTPSSSSSSTFSLSGNKHGVLLPPPLCVLSGSLGARQSGLTLSVKAKRDDKDNFNDEEEVGGDPQHHLPPRLPVSKR